MLRSSVPRMTVSSMVPAAARPWAIISAGLAPTLLTEAYLLADLLQLVSGSPMRTAISAMAGQAGTDRWVMTGGIFGVSGCYLVTAVFQRRTRRLHAATRGSRAGRLPPALALAVTGSRRCGVTCPRSTMASWTRHPPRRGRVMPDTGQPAAEPAVWTTGG